MYKYVHTIEGESGPVPALRESQPVHAHNALCCAGNGPSCDDRSRDEATRRPQGNRASTSLQTPLTTFQPLTRRLNDLATIRVCSLQESWNLATTARVVENGTPPRWTNPPGAARVTSRTARSAASRMFFASSTTTRRTSSASPPNWSERKTMNHEGHEVTRRKSAKAYERRDPACPSWFMLLAVQLKPAAPHYS